MLEGRGALLAIDRRLNVLTPDVPDLAGFRSELAYHRRMYYDLYKLSNPENLHTLHKDPVEAMRIVSSQVFMAIGEAEYERALDELDELGEQCEIHPPTSPLVVAAYLAHEYEYKAAICAFKGLTASFKWIGLQAGKQAVPVQQERIWYLKQMRMEIVQGYGASSTEEKSLLQGELLLSYGVAHGEITEKEAEDFIKATVESLKWAYISTNIHPGWNKFDREAAAKFTELMSTVYGKAARFLETFHAIETLSFEPPTLPGPERVYWPCSFYILDRDYWLGGLREITSDAFKPYKGFAWRSTQEHPGVSLVLGPQGVGKTTITDSILRSALEDGCVVLVLKSDERNQSCFHCMPGIEMGVGDAENRALEKTRVMFLREKMRVTPHAVPTMILNVIHPSQKSSLEEYALTKYDRVIVRNTLGNFHVDVEELMKQAQHVHDLFPDPKPKGTEIVVRNLGREGEGGGTNEEQVIAANLVMNIRQWRQNHHTPPIFLKLDEIQDVLPRSSTKGEAASDTSRIAGQLLKALKHMRGFDFSAVGNTQFALDVVQNWISTARNILIKELPQDQVGFLFDRMQGKQSLLPINEESERATVRELASEGSPLHGTRLWVLYDRMNARCEIVWANPHPMCPEQPRMDMKSVYRRVEELTGQEILVSWKYFNDHWKDIEICKEGSAAESLDLGAGRFSELGKTMTDADELQL